MSKKFSTKPLRGMKDYYPPDLREINWIINTIRDVAELYSYEEFESPRLESIEIFAAKSSDELVNEQSFIVEKKKRRKVNTNSRTYSIVSTNDHGKKSRT